MGESPEHQFLKQTVLDVLEEFSRLQLYGVTEAARRRFDFSCRLERDWTRLLAGQAAWRNQDGIEKDVRTLLTDSESEIKAFVVRDTLAHRRLVDEAVADFSRLTPIEPFRFKTFWVPSDFDADDEHHRRYVRDRLRAEIVDDILFKVVFGQVDAQSLRPLLDTTGRIDLVVALLAYIAERPLDNRVGPSSALGVSPNTIDRRLIALQTAGLVRNLPRTLVAEVSPAGRTVLDILARLDLESSSGVLTSELAYILGRLGCHVPDELVLETLWTAGPSTPFVRLMQVLAATKEAGVRFSDLHYTTIAEQSLIPPGYEEPWALNHPDPGDVRGAAARAASDTRGRPPPR
ncbi:MAG TPA: hypothetical protein VKB10_11105 [Gaiellaceae bacterium]|nr:hypothetical protein [Gaiellaceae bacterium]